MVAEPSELERAARDRDRALVEAHQTGDSTAFAIIVRDHYPTLLAQATRRLGSRAEAEDAVQEALERAYRVFGRFGGEYRLAAWLSRIVANVCNDHGNRRSAERRLPERIAQRIVPTGDVSDTVSDPAALATVQAAIDALRPSQRDAFLLHEVGGLSYERLAGQLGISEDNARARVHRAKSALRRSLDQARTGLAALIGVRLGAPALARRVAGPFAVGDPPARPSRSPALPPGSPVGGMELGATPAPSLPSLPAAASQAAASPLAQVAATVASSGPRGNLVAWLATGLATALTGLLSGPGAATLPAMAAAAVSTGSTTAATASTPDPSTTVTAKPAAAAPSDRTADSAPPAPPTLAAWIAAAASYAVPAANPSGPPTVSTQACPLGNPSGSADSGPLTGPVVAVLSTPVVDGITVPDPSLATAATLTVTGSGVTTTAVQLQASACLPPSGWVLAATVSGPGANYTLYGTLVRTVVDATDADYVFRGTAVPPSAVAGSDAAPTPGAPEGFVALLDVRQPAGTAASLTVAFFGLTRAPAGPPAARPSTSSPSTPGATAAPSTSGTTPSGGATTGGSSSGTGTAAPGGPGAATSADPTPARTTSTTAPPAAGSSP